MANDLMTTLSHSAVDCLDRAVFFVPAKHPNHDAVIEQLSVFGLRLAREAGMNYDRSTDDRGTRFTFARSIR